MARKTSAECLKDPDLTAFICISDYCAYGVMEALSERDLRVPEDYSLCGLDDMFPSSLPGVRLTTIDRHPIEIGASSLDLLWQRITSPALPTLTHVTRVEYLSTLIDRGSCASPERNPKSRRTAHESRYTNHGHDQNQFRQNPDGRASRHERHRKGKHVRGVRRGGQSQSLRH